MDNTTKKGAALYYNLIKNPHLLIAGETGSGKSVILNGIIYTLLLKDNDCKFILIDPKKVELRRYKTTKQTLLYADTEKDIKKALQYSIDAMIKRYKTMARHGLNKWPGAGIYICIDEMADVILTNKNNIKYLQRIAQLGRAAGVHLIGCTQTPIAAVLPTKIKVNMDARVALHTRSKQDSRNILDTTGAEMLPRYGYAIYMAPGTFERVPVPMVPNHDIKQAIKENNSILKQIINHL